MKLFIKLMVLLLLIAGAAPFILKRPDGRPLLRLDEFNINKPLSKGINKINSITPVESDVRQVYKWKDESGIVHYSDEKSPHHQSQLIEIKTQNSQQPRQQPSPKKTTTLKKSTQAVTKQQAPIAENAVSIAKMQQLINDAKKAKYLIEQRNQRVQQIVKNE